MKQYGKIDGPKAHDHKEEIMDSASYEDEGFHLSNTQPRKGWKDEPKSPHILHATKDKHQLVCTMELDNAKAVEMVWRLERNKFKRSGACTKG